MQQVIAPGTVSWRFVFLILAGLILTLLALPFARGEDLVDILITFAIFLGCWFAILLAVRLLHVRTIRACTFLDRFSSTAEGWLTRGRAGLLLVGGIALYTLVWSVLSILRHQGLNSSGFDLAIAHQVVWNLAHGRGFASSIEVSNYLGDHVAITLPLVAPFLWIWDDVRILLIVQSLILGLGAWPLYRLATRRCGRRLDGLVWAAVYLLTPAIGFMNKYDFHELVFAAPLLLAAIDAIDAGRLRTASVWMLLAVLTREEVGLAVASVGIYHAIACRKRLWGIGWGLIGVVWAVLAIYLIIPHFREGASSDTLARYAWLGGEPGEIVRTVFTKPWTLLSTHYHRVRRVFFGVQLLWPLAGLPLFGLGRLLVALPNLGLSITSSAISQNSIYFQYNAPILPIVFWAGVAGYQRLVRRIGSAGLAMAALLVCLLGANIADPAAWKDVTRPYTIVQGIVPRPNIEAFREATRLIPPDADVLASNNLAPQLSARLRLHVLHLRRPNPDASWIVCDLTDTRHLESRKGVAELIAAWVENKGYRVAYLRDGILLLRKEGSAAPGAAERLRTYLAHWGQALP